jgi:hypothetical protein
VNSVAIYTTFFLCDPKQLPEGFPGWQLPLEQPRRRLVSNPFKGELAEIETDEPDWSDDAKTVQIYTKLSASAITDFQDFLEARLCPFVRRQPHWATKGLTEVELTPLARVVGVNFPMSTALYAPPAAGGIVQNVPAELLLKLLALRSSDLEPTAMKWATTLSNREFTHSTTGIRISTGWTPEEAVDALNSIVGLARRADSGQRMYLLTEA